MVVEIYLSSLWYGVGSGAYCVATRGNAKDNLCLGASYGVPEERQKKRRMHLETDHRSASVRI